MPGSEWRDSSKEGNVLAGFADVGIGSSEILEALARRFNLNLPAEIFDFSKIPSKDIVSQALEHIVERCKKLDTQFQSYPNSDENLAYLFRVIVALLPHSGNGASAQQITEHFFKIVADLKTKSRAGAVQAYKMELLQGLTYNTYAQFLPDAASSPMRERLLASCPIGILPSLELESLPEEIKKQHSLTADMPVTGAVDLAVPAVIKDEYEQDNSQIKEDSFIVCDRADSLHYFASKKPESSKLITYNGLLLGGIKMGSHYGEKSFLAITSTQKNGRVCLLEKGIYQFKTRLPLDQDVINLADFPDVRMVPLRMWREANMGIELGYEMTKDSYLKRWDAIK